MNGHWDAAVSFDAGEHVISVETTRGRGTHERDHGQGAAIRRLDNPRWQDRPGGVDLPDGRRRYVRARSRLLRWFGQLRPRLELVLVHENGLAQSLAREVKASGDGRPLLILTGHDHKQHQNADQLRAGASPLAPCEAGGCRCCLPRRAGSLEAEEQPAEDGQIRRVSSGYSPAPWLATQLSVPVSAFTQPPAKPAPLMRSVPRAFLL